MVVYFRQKVKIFVAPIKKMATVDLILSSATISLLWQNQVYTDQPIPQVFK